MSKPPLWVFGAFAAGLIGLALYYFHLGWAAYLDPQDHLPHLSRAVLLMVDADKTTFVIIKTLRYGPSGTAAREKFAQQLKKGREEVLRYEQSPEGRAAGDDAASVYEIPRSTAPAAIPGLPGQPR